MAKPVTTKASSRTNEKKKPAGAPSRKTVHVSATELVVGLREPGMTPMLRAGVGGLAASLRAIQRATDADQPWPSPIKIGPGEALVERERVVLRWPPKRAEQCLQALLHGSFAIRKPGIIHLPGAFGSHASRGTALAVALQNALKRTFLQHGKSTQKAGSPVTLAAERDGEQVPVKLQPYKSFAHRDAIEDILNALRRGSVPLAGWSYPGNAGRHNGFARDTEWRYSAPQAMAALFAIVGCLSFEVAFGRGALVIVEPSDLTTYAHTRPALTPRNLVDVYVTGVGDAVLSVQLALRIEAAQHAPGVAAVHGVLLRTTPWASQQKSRAATVSIAGMSSQKLDLYDLVVRSLPTRIRLRNEAGTKRDGDADQEYFAATSALRGFVTDNVARGARWFADFAAATTPGKRPRFIHYYRDKDNLGAMYPDEKKGLIAMLQHLEEAEAVLVRSIHLAIRSRFGAIAEEAGDKPSATMKNRFQSERDRWRMAFAGAKTPEQIRAALADLWSRAGFNKELQANWQLVLPLLRPAHWQTARDLALVGLASYASAKVDNDETMSEGEEQ